MKQPDVIIIGAGVMGCSVAWRLAKAGLKPLVLERSVPGAEASSAAAGILAPMVEAHHERSVARPAAALQLGIRSRELHATQADELREAHGLDIGYRRCGVMRVAFDEHDREDLREHVALVPELRLIDADDALELEPSLSKDVCGALLADTEAQLEPRRLLDALAIAAERAGAVFRTGAFVQRLEAGAHPRVELGDETFSAEHVIVAAGSWTHLIPGLEAHVNLDAVGLHPVRGQIVATRTRPPLFRRVVFGGGGYVVTRPDGRVLVGSTEERVGFRREVTFEGMRSILGIGMRVAPSLGRAAVLDHWSSFRPGTSDGLPLVGAVGRGVWLASGHFRNGILLAPVTAEILAASILGAEPIPGADAIEPSRFGGGA